MISFKEYLTEVAAPIHDYEWDDDKVGYHVTTHGKPVHFYPAKSKFDRGVADSDAKKHVVKLKYADHVADTTKREHDYQMNKPLSEVEKRWVEMDKRLHNSLNSKKDMMSDEELTKYVSYGKAVRKSLLNHSHPAMEHRKK